MRRSQPLPENTQPPKTKNDTFFREVQIEFLIHELKDPISVAETGIKTLLAKRDKYGSLNDSQEKILNRVLRNTKKAREMLNNLMEIGRAEAGCFVSCRFQPGKAAYEALLDALETKAYRSVGQAMRRNPYAPEVP